MSPEKLAAARAAIERLIFKLLDEDDELFFVEFATRAEITQGWTTDRQLISDALKQVIPVGGTALYDAVAAALPTGPGPASVWRPILPILESLKIEA